MPRNIPLLLAISAALALAAPPDNVRIGKERRLSLDQNWRFQKGDTSGAQTAAFDDSNWRTVDVPHDWAIEGPFDRNINPHAGALPYFGVAWYRKTFTLSGDTTGKRYRIEFDGAMSNARVWLNGEELGGRPYGYSSFGFEIPPSLIVPGKPNVLAVRLAPEPESSRWYPGAGIYRNVWLDATGPVRVAHWGTYITTPSVANDRATVAVRTTVRNDETAPVEIVLETSVLDASGKQVASNSARMSIAAGRESTTEGQLTVGNPHRWEVEDPYLYTAISVVKRGDSVLDRYTTSFGIRTIEFDAKRGFLLNGRYMKLQGVCLHHDLGALGTAVNRRAIERQLEIMKAMGANAVRTSHNPPAPELLDLADRLGVLIMDEAFDMWHIPKVKNGLSKFFDQWSETDLRDMIRRDRNHTSVIMWSIGNEIPEQGRADGWQIAKKLTDVCHQEDPTRPTTAAFNMDEAAIKNKLADNVDVPGFNYKPFHYAKILEEHPNWAIVGAETSSCVSSRGVYHLPIEKYQKHPSHQLTSYDIISPPWAYLPDPEFEAQEKLPQVLGEFVWTGFDYLGEPTPYFMGRGAAVENDWPARSSYFGIVDLAGFPKDRYYLYQSLWTKKPMVHVLPHWNWAGREGQNIPVMAYTNADSVELFLNGRSLGRKTRGAEPVELPVGPNISKDGKYSTRYRLMWQVPYEPGSLKAVAYTGGKQVAQDEVETAGAPARITLTPDRKRITAGGDDLSFVTVRIEDKDGNLCPDADNLVRFNVQGAGRIAAVDNGNAATTESFQADHRKAFNGLALLIVRSDKVRTGNIRVSATAEGLRGAEVSLAAANGK